MQGGAVAIAVYFHPKGMTLQQFNEVDRLLKESGKDDPSARIHHSCFGEDGDLMVFDVWDSPEAFQAFGEVLMPLITKVGIDVGEPAVMPIHRLEQVTRNL
jgi:hypothetical protein